MRTTRITTVSLARLRAGSRTIPSLFWGRVMVWLAIAVYRLVRTFTIFPYGLSAVEYCEAALLGGFCFC
jgi:hypothetical protein